VNPEGALHQAGGTGHIHGAGGSKTGDEEKILQESKGPGGKGTKG
jgi:hypothetical protein